LDKRKKGLCVGKRGGLEYTLHAAKKGPGQVGRKIIKFRAGGREKGRVFLFPRGGGARVITGVLENGPPCEGKVRRRHQQGEGKSQASSQAQPREKAKRNRKKREEGWAERKRTQYQGSNCPGPEREKKTLAVLTGKHETANSKWGWEENNHENSRGAGPRGSHGNPRVGQGLSTFWQRMAIEQNRKEPRISLIAKRLLIGL